MPYKYLDNIAIADAAFEAWGDTLEEMFRAAAAAAMNVMVADLDAIGDRVQKTIELQDNALDMLLLNFLQELIFYKDAEQLLLRIKNVAIKHEKNHYSLTAAAYGEPADPQKHDLVVDVKAVTLHRLKVEKTPHQWRSTVVLDI